MFPAESVNMLSAEVTKLTKKNEELETKVKDLVVALFSEIQRHCCGRIEISGNVECTARRRIIAGLGGCLCKEENCHKIQDVPPTTEDTANTLDSKMNAMRKAKEQIKTPWGSFDPQNKVWHPNPLLTMSAKEQYERNDRNGLMKGYTWANDKGGK